MALTLVPKKYKRTGLLGLGDGPPSQIAGVFQRVTYDAPPVLCDKPRCGSRDIRQDLEEPRRYFCWECHSDWFIVQAPWRRVSHARMAP